MEYEIKITGSGTLQQLKDALAAIAANINVDDVYDDGHEDEGPYLATVISACNGEDEEYNEWVCTDPDNYQYRRRTGKRSWDFVEQRATGEFSSEIDLDEYTLEQMQDACKTFGYDSVIVAKWWVDEENLEIIAECIFELQN